MKNRFNLGDVDSNYAGDDWRQGISALLKRDLEGIQQSISEYETTTLSFKSSSKKSDHSLRYIPVNLHIHIFKMTGETSPLNKVPDIELDQPSITNYTCDFITVGAFAAHSMKFKSGGLWHMMKMFDEKLSKQTKGLIPMLKDDFRLPDEVIFDLKLSSFPSIDMESSLNNTTSTRQQNLLYGIQCKAKI